MGIYEIRQNIQPNRENFLIPKQSKKDTALKNINLHLVTVTQIVY